MNPRGACAPRRTAARDAQLGPICSHAVIGPKGSQWTSPRHENGSCLCTFYLQFSLAQHAHHHSRPKSSIRPSSATPNGRDPNPLTAEISTV